MSGTTTPTFTGLRKYGLGGTIAVDVTLDVDTIDFVHLIGKKVIVDGSVVRCVDIDKSAHDSPWRAGETVTLIIDHGAT
jgi:hypothetical protein